MGEWHYVAFAATTDVQSVEVALQVLLETAGYEVLPTAPELSREAMEMLQYGTGAANDTWFATVSPAANGWVAIETLPVELLVERDGEAPRLTRLSRLADVPVFHASLFDSMGPQLVEALPDGRWHLSGYRLSDDPLSCHGFTVPEAYAQPQFALMPGKDTLNQYLTLSKSLATTLGAPGELADFSPDRVQGRLIAARRRPDPTLPHLPVQMRRTHGGSRRILHLGDGELWLQGERLECPTPRDADAVLSAVAEWFGVPLREVPPSPLPSGVWCAVETQGTDTILKVGERFAGELRLHDDAGASSVSTTTQSREALLDTLQKGLAMPPETWRLRTPPTRFLRSDWSAESTLVTAGWHRTTSELWEFRDLETEPTSLGTVPDLIYAMSCHPEEPIVAACLVTPDNPDRVSIGDDTPARISLIDLRSLEERRLLESGPGETLAWASPCWLDADTLVFDVSRRPETHARYIRPSQVLNRVRGPAPLGPMPSPRPIEVIQLDDRRLLCRRVEPTSR